MCRAGTIMALLWLAAWAACAQQQTEMQTSGPLVMFGGGDRPELRFAGELTPTNLLLVNAAYALSYDTNPLGLADPPQGDRVQSASGQLSFLRTGERITTRLEYRPSYEGFGHYSSYDYWNHAVSADARVKWGPRWSTRLRNEFAEQRGGFATIDSGPVSGGIAPPTGLNTTIYAPFNLERTESARVDLDRAGSVRSSQGIFAGFAQRTYPEAEAGFFSTREESAGAEILWRLRSHLSSSLVAYAARMDLFGVGLGTATANRMDSVSVFPTVAWRPRPHLDLMAYGGPQVIRQAAPGGQVAPVEVRLAGGGALTGGTERSAWSLAADHLVTDGGGLISFVVSSDVRAELQHRMGSRWELALEAQYGFNRWLPVSGASGTLNSKLGRATLNRKIGTRLSFAVEYLYLAQKPSGTLGFGTKFDSSRVTSGISWTWQTAPWAR